MSMYTTKRKSLPKEQRLSRREALFVGGTCGIGAVVATSSRAAVQTSTTEDPPKQIATAKSNAHPRNIIFMVADGMSMGVPTLADPFSRLVRGRGSVWSQLLREPTASHGFLETRSANSLVTDSAAAASAWGCGSRVNNGVLNILPDGRKQTPISHILQEHNKRVGLVTTDKITGATPSGFAVVQENRRDYMEIADQFIDRADIVLGGGRQYFEMNTRPDKRDLVAEYMAKGYQYCSSRRELLKLPPTERILGVFAEDTLPYAVDQLSDITLQQLTPTLVELTQVALDNLSDKDDGFFLMVEGGRIDHAAHSNDAAALLHEQIAFEDAIGTALEFARGRDDTLLVITSDHGNANPGLNGFGPGYVKTDESFARLGQVSASFDSIRNQLRNEAGKMDLPDAVRSVLDKTWGFSIDTESARVIGEALVMEKMPNELAILQRSWVGVLSQILGNYTGIGFTGTNHTADRTMLSAIGPGANCFMGIRTHFNMFHHFVELMDLTVA